jgi:hypothetical protein
MGRAQAALGSGPAGGQAWERLGSGSGNGVFRAWAPVPQGRRRQRRSQAGAEPMLWERAGGAEPGDMILDCAPESESLRGGQTYWD